MDLRILHKIWFKTILDKRPKKPKTDAIQAVVTFAQLRHWFMHKY